MRIALLTLALLLPFTLFAGKMMPDPPGKEMKSPSTVAIPDFDAIKKKFSAVDPLTNYLAGRGDDYKDVRCQHPELLKGDMVSPEILTPEDVGTGIFAGLAVGVVILIIVGIVLIITLIVAAILGAFQDACNQSCSWM